METKRYDIVVIGAGSGGLTAAVGASKIGKKVLLIEREHMGGECTNSGCIPSKALLHHAKQFYTATQVAGETDRSETYRRNAFRHVRSVIADILKTETPETFATLGIDVVMGEAVFVDQCSVRVADTTYQYKRAVIATGSTPRTLTIGGLEPNRVLTNQNLFQLEDIPSRTLIIGSGPIGLEMGQALAMLGSHVTIATIDHTFARLEDPALRPIIEASFANLNITLLKQAYIERVEGDHAIFTIKQNDRIIDEKRIAFDKVLVAIGRIPNFPGGLTAAGIKYDERCILVDKQYRTSNKYVYALGDVAQRLKFTHTADDSARQVITHIASKGWLRIKRNKSVPKVTYTTPEVAQVGLSSEEAQTKYGDDRLMRIEVPLIENDRAKTDNSTDGVLVVIARRLSGQVLGAHYVGPRAGEVIALFSLAIDEKISVYKLQKHIFAYPTYALVVKKAADKFFGQQITDLKQDVMVSLRHNATKLIAGVIWVTALFALYRYQTNHEMTTTESALKLFDFVTMTAWGPLVYILIYAIRPVTFFPATALTILAGIFFGFVWGTILTIIAATLAACVAYSVGRFFGANLRLEDSVLGNWVEALRTNTFEAILTTRLIFLPFDLISYAAGILQTRFFPFVIATTLGIILGTATFVSIGASLDVEEFKMEGFTPAIIDPKFLALSVMIFVISIGVSKIFKRWRIES